MSDEVRFWRERAHEQARKSYALQKENDELRRELAIMADGIALRSQLNALRDSSDRRWDVT